MPARSENNMAAQMPTWLLGIAVALLCLCPSGHAQDNPTVAFLSPAGKGDVFFQPMTDFMQAAADDLGFNLEVYYCERERSHVVYDELIHDILGKTTLPDYIIGMNPRGAGIRLPELANAAGVPFIIINQGFLGSAREMVGRPGEKYKTWLFEYLPDDIHSGYLVAKTLIEQALADGLVDSEGKVNVVGVNGHKRSAASALRARGLEKAVAEFPQARLLQNVHGDWSRGKAYEQATLLLKRYPEATVIWTASDITASGVIKAIKDEGKKPGKDVLTGGVDWTREGLNNVETGEASVSVGGHFMDGGWALVMLYDKIHGVNVQAEESHFSKITVKNRTAYKRHFGAGDWSKIDFKKFSKHLNPQNGSYDFGLDAVLSQVRE